ncbi:hypothetical protein RJ639_021762 [Escallonia herrerae]|uniref:STAS domain-containing protein n=1 Tax=Escallonia herrerae TaxID=1293975 RepID=A0AA88V3E5_9ASTE|nr:hypothetical protein RJ639_021762 [Escallonia herrerae]
MGDKAGDCMQPAHLILRWLNDEEEKLKAAVLPRIRFLIVEMSPVTDIDTSGVHALDELRRSLQKRDVQKTMAGYDTSSGNIKRELCFVFLAGNIWDQ